MDLYYLLSAILIAFITAFASALAVNLFKFLLRSYPSFPVFQFLRSRIIKYKSLKLESLGYRVYMYITWVDGKNIRLSQMEKETKLMIKDPIVFKQHPLRDLPFKTKVGCIAFDIETKEIVGKAFRINSDSNEIKDFEIINKKDGI